MTSTLLSESVSTADPTTYSIKNAQRATSTTEATDVHRPLEDECAEIHTIQIFREANDDADQMVLHSNMSLPTPQVTGTQTTTTMASMNQGNAAAYPSSAVSFPISSFHEQQQQRLQHEIFMAPDGGVGDDKAVLDMVVTEDDDDNDDCAFGIDGGMLSATNPTSTTSTTTTTLLHHDFSTIIENSNDGTTNNSNNNNFYSFFFDDEAVNKENLDSMLDTPAGGGCDDNDNNGDNFTITSQDTDSSPDDWMDLDVLDGNSVLQDSTSFWEHGLTAATTVEATHAGSELETSLSLAPPSSDATFDTQVHARRRVSVLSQPQELSRMRVGTRIMNE